tara:strand:+ start:704 stop:1405 length:702 start_codon:yes stop_codon:yes gene_type:complete
MAISVSEAILRRQGGGPSYADLQSPPGQSPPGQSLPSQNFNLGVSPFDTLGETFTRGLNSASKSVSDFFTVSPVAPLSNTIGKIGDVASFFTPAGFALSGIAGLGEFSALNESLDDIYGVPEDQQLGIMDALYAALPGPTLQGQYAKALDEYNQSRQSIRGFNNPKDAFNTVLGFVGPAGRVGDPTLGDFVGPAGRAEDSNPNDSVDIGIGVGDDDSDLGGYGGFSETDGSTI